MWNKRIWILKRSDNMDENKTNINWEITTHDKLPKIPYFIRKCI